MTQSSDENYLTTAEVADRLKVKPETIYAYVSRGLLTSRRARGRRGSLFAEADVERLASRSVDHPGAIERIESKLTLLTDDELYYRGHPVRALATTQTVESVARLLWSGEPDRETDVLPGLLAATRRDRAGGAAGTRRPGSQDLDLPAAMRRGRAGGVPLTGSADSDMREGRAGGAARVSRTGSADSDMREGRAGGAARVSRTGSADPDMREGRAGEAARVSRTGSADPEPREVQVGGGSGVVEPFPAPREGVELARAAMAVAPAGARLTDKLRIAVAVLGAGDPLRFDLAPHSVEVAASRLLGVLVTALPGPAGKGSFGGRLWPKLSTKRPARPELLDAAVILLADHGLAVSTIAARVAASARANLYAVVSAGLGALDGHLHGAATTLAYEFLGRALEDPVRALSDQLRSGEPVPGFGHKLYQNRDPRAEVLLELLGDTPVVETVQTLTAQLPGFPNSDLAVAAMMHAHNFRPDAGEALFALARIIGWTAHALEEYAQPALRFRPEGIYTGQSTQPT
ncbi:excisionase family DNA binding protein [Kribbella sp. VKM Ac-2527]|uniref:citrate synthase (unknown stereospecificity) n=1 Tax=Kribbella caucasensis TaxID=2512215 RepID=A0A4R6KQD1_9ACTN|nr:citrate/2-methylcitrate synthase [Kribbella sp. VKM Ac-2527]TDO52570.1 excisionase family DNA binding protein [Kribbella sp. VKM Ac-2527]